MSQTGHAINWELVHVFISSTFDDMHAERDYLVKKVFPELQEWCGRRKLRLVDIDLRWGVTETDATYNRNAVKVCLERIDDCRPFFLCFLGSGAAGCRASAMFPRTPIKSFRNYATTSATYRSPNWRTSCPVQSPPSWSLPGRCGIRRLPGEDGARAILLSRPFLSRGCPTRTGTAQRDLYQ